MSWINLHLSVNMSDASSSASSLITHTHMHACTHAHMLTQTKSTSSRILKKKDVRSLSQTHWMGIPQCHLCWSESIISPLRGRRAMLWFWAFLGVMSDVLHRCKACMLRLFTLNRRRSNHFYVGNSLPSKWRKTNSQIVEVEKVKYTTNSEEWRWRWCAQLSWP